VFTLFRKKSITVKRDSFDYPDLQQSDTDVPRINPFVIFITIPSVERTVRFIWQITGRWIMGGKGRIFQQAKKLSPEDRLTFNRWLQGNAVVGFILAAGLVAMVMTGSNSGSHEPASAGGKMAPDVVATAHK
jgi:hypothetical protein